jgi:peptide/nickel transport system ATP-binding protein
MATQATEVAASPGLGGTLEASPENEADRALLSVRNLRVTFPTPYGPVAAVDGLDLEVKRGERVGLVGESGSGKSVTALSILGLVRGARVEGQVWYDGRELLSASGAVRRRIRGAGIGLIFQDPLSSLNPIMTVGDQIAEALTVRGTSRKEAVQRSMELLSRVGIRNAGRRLRDYPHQFSGGMRQRAMIAIALAANPALLIADEPTTALDVIVQAQVLELLEELAAERHMALLLITHDLGIVAGNTDRVVVMYAGRAVEESPVDQFFYGSTMPYTWGLLGSLPRLDRPPVQSLPVIGGQPPSPHNRPAGCAFHPRCVYAQEVCRQVVPELVVHEFDDHRSACHFAGSLPRPDFLPTRKGTP